MPKSPPDSEDQTTPQAPRKFYVPKQTSVESTNSFSENDEMNEGQAAIKTLLREDPETTKKKEMHKNLMSEALKKVEMRNIQKKNFSQLARTNPTLAALNIVTRKELKMEEMQEKYEQESDQKKMRHKSGSASRDDSSSNTSASAVVNSGVLATFRELSIHKGPSSNQNSASRQAAIAAKKASTPVKPDIGPKPSISNNNNNNNNNNIINSEPVKTQDNIDPGTPVVVLRKQPRILEPDELKARTSGSAGTAGKHDTTAGNAGTGHEALPAKTTINKDSLVKESKVEQIMSSRMSETSSQAVSTTATTKTPDKNNLSQISSATSKDSPGVKRAVQQTFSSQERKPHSPKATPSVKGKDDRTEKAIEKINAAKEIGKQQKVENSKSAKQSLEGLVHVKPKQESSKSDSNNNVSENNNNDNTPKMVKRAAEKFEANLSEKNSKEFSGPGVNFSSNIRGRSKSISNRLREQMEDSGRGTVETNNKSLPWSARSPPVLRRRDASRNNKGESRNNSDDQDTQRDLLQD